MTDLPLLEKYPGAPDIFVKAITSPIFGGDGGNPDSPIWFCALEWGGGFSEEKPCIPEKYFYVDETASPIPTNEVRDGLHGIWKRDTNGQVVTKSRSTIYQMYVMLLTSIITGEIKAEVNAWDDLEHLVKTYKFFSKDSYGFLLNAFPISMKNRDGAKENWKNERILAPKNRMGTTSFADWTTIPSFGEYTAWSARLRSYACCEYRRLFHPALIYCGGISNEDELFVMWSGIKDWRNQKKEVFFTDKMSFKYLWLDNGTNINPTLLAVGPFYNGCRRCLNNRYNCENLGKNLRKLCNNKFGGEVWLQREKFDPTYHK